MKRIKVAVAGASGIGKYHAREFHTYGCEVAAILGRTAKTAKETAKNLQQQFGIDANPYHSLKALVQGESISAISICTPSRLHQEQAEFCLNNGLHVLCEKPLTYSLQSENYWLSKELFSLANKKNRVLTVNTQWPAVLGYITSEIRLEEIEKFEFHMESGCRGTDLLMDSLPHANSLLIGLTSEGEVSSLGTEKHGDYLIKVLFDYKNAGRMVEVSYELVFSDRKPREVSFTVNEKKFCRVVGKNYQQSLAINEKIIPIEDPLKISIRKFVDSLRNKSAVPLVSEKAALKNAFLSDLILKEYTRSD